MALKGREYLRKQLTLKRSRVLLRYKYYDMKNGIKYFRTFGGFFVQVQVLSPVLRKSFIYKGLRFFIVFRVLFVSYLF